jgi:hypothetical protein
VGEDILVGECAATDVADPAVLGVVDTALLSLPERYRQAVILRYLQNHSEKDAARLVGCPLGTLSRRASEGIAMLRKRLGKLGVATSAMSLAGLLTSEASAAVPETLLPSILAVVKTAVATTATATAAVLAKGAMKTMFWNSAKTAAMVAVSVGVLGVGGVAAVQAVAEKAETTAKPVPISHKGVGSDSESFAARFKMVGVVIRADSSKSIALVETGAVTSRTFFVRVGDKVNDHTLAVINYENASATFTKDNSTTTLSLSNAVRSGVAGAPPPPRGIALQRQMHDQIETNMVYESRLRERREKIRAQTNALTRTREDLDKVLMQYLTEQIRKGGPFLPVKLTPEADDTLVKEGVLPPTGGTEHGTPGRGAGVDVEGQGGK